MTTKTTGAEFKRFYSDVSFWPEGAYHDDQVIKVDGEQSTEATDLNAIADSATVLIEAGYVVLPSVEEGQSLESYFRRWRKQQTVRTLVVDVDASKLDVVIEAIKAAGGSVR
ncbi:hypothetical protein [Cupriavidus sp. TMH.W2]|uniref:hypothetical protein n=1 Tax=Cupriavidus sp. TMH.W2 TaxID=3434465 RepID=UPI003D77B7A9